MSDEKKQIPKYAFEQAVIEEVWRNESFREKLLADPKKAITETFGIKFGTVNLKVIEETENEMILIIPRKPEGVETELTEAELENISGGYATDSNDPNCNTPDIWETCSCPHTTAWDYTCDLNSNCQ